MAAADICAALTRTQVLDATLPLVQQQSAEGLAPWRQQLGRLVDGGCAHMTLLFLLCVDVVIIGAPPHT